MSRSRQHELRRGDLDPGRQVDRDLCGDLRDRADADGPGAKAPGALPGSLRAEPGRPLWPPAAARRRGQAGQQGALPARERDPVSVADRPGDRRLHRRRHDGDPPVRRRQERGRLLRHRRPDRDPLLLRLRLDRLLRAAARRLGVRLEVQLPGRDAGCGPADLLRDLDGPGPARGDHDGRLAVAGLGRRGAEPDLVHRPPVRRLPDLHGRRLRGDQPGALRPARGRRRAGRRLRDRVRRHALRLLRDGRVHRDVRRSRGSP